ncbi:MULTISPECIES: hypothetical protein [unclassified Arsukibacterium]|uniref:hypothetical protein n=1 Tax=unclassified Arsukibacterium TaxID=2635278 RepID=UPI000C56C929|nr:MULTISPECIES: hypothetical protein [unclassified Arsukibacterium]MAA96338.1 hypothetical protein [Rheinheimera sp.]MBM33818.1 hypothetical protein [Rheinheimera sp.]|tara:strand:+ start:248 stop:592 length:345 start_codon:yes stop_codon:yes gene_type:complete
MNYYLMCGFSLGLTLLPGEAWAWQTEPAQQPEAKQSAPTVQVDISTTISGNQEQPRTLYVLPWQDSIAQIRIPAPDINVTEQPLQPLDRQQFLRFIEAQSLQQPSATTASSKDN